jgi:hypothetical protein
MLDSLCYSPGPPKFNEPWDSRLLGRYRPDAKPVVEKGSRCFDPLGPVNLDCEALHEHAAYRPCSRCGVLPFQHPGQGIIRGTDAIVTNAGCISSQSSILIPPMPSFIEPTPPQAIEDQSPITSPDYSLNSVTSQSPMQASPPLDILSSSFADLGNVCQRQEIFREIDHFCDNIQNRWLDGSKSALRGYGEMTGAVLRCNKA